MEEKTEASIQETMWSIVERIEDPESHMGLLVEQLERIANSLEKIEKRGRPDPMYGLF